MVDVRMKHNLIQLLVLLLVMRGGAALAGLTATVDRQMVAHDETLVLTISKDSSSFFTNPDLGPLEDNFEVLSKSQQSSTQIINGKASSTVAWKIVLSPKRVGRLEIPPISVGKEKTEPVFVQVVKQAPLTRRDENSMFFIETDIDSREVLVQAQLLFTLRIYWAVNAQIMDPADPQVADAILTRLDDTSYDKVVDGRAYKVYERKYAIFPQKSGVLEIPAMSVQVVRQSRDFFGQSGIFGTGGDKFVLRSEAKQVTVLEKPADYPPSSDWLPATGLTVADEWSGNPMDLASGESITLTLTMRAEGLMAEQLPPIELLEPEGVNLYQGKAELNNIPTANGVLGMRRESIALIPTRSGTVEMPEIRIPWWDKEDKAVAYAVIPAQKLVIRGPSLQPDTPSPATEPGNVGQPVSPVPAVTQPQKQVLSPVVLVLCGLLAMAWLVTLFLFVQTRRQLKAALQEGAIRTEHERSLREKDAFAALTRVCRSNDPAPARAAVMLWARSFWNDETIQTYTDIEKVASGSGLIPLLNEIDSALYSRESSDGGWQGARLLEGVRKIRASRTGKQTSESPLQSLYKNVMISGYR